MLSIGPLGSSKCLYCDWFHRRSWSWIVQNTCCHPRRRRRRCSTLVGSTYLQAYLDQLCHKAFWTAEGQLSSSKRWNVLSRVPWESNLLTISNVKPLFRSPVLSFQVFKFETFILGPRNVLLSYQYLFSISVLKRVWLIDSEWVSKEALGHNTTRKSRLIWI